MFVRESLQKRKKLRLDTKFVNIFLIVHIKILGLNIQVIHQLFPTD